LFSSFLVLFLCINVDPFCSLVLYIGAVFMYVATHIDEIKAQQKVAVDAAMTEQASNVRSAQEKQKEAIEKARLQQEAAIRKIQEDAKNRR